MLDGQPFDVGATCLEEAEVTVVGATACALLLQQRPELLLSSFRNLATKGRQQRRMMVGLAVESAEQRAAQALLLLASKIGTPTDGGVQFSMPLTRIEFSELIGTTSETAIRIFSRFRKSGLIGEKGGQLTIKAHPEWESLGPLGEL